MRMSGIYGLPTPGTSPEYRTFMDQILPFILRQREEQQQQRIPAKSSMPTPQFMNQMQSAMRPPGETRDVIYKPPVSETVEGQRLGIEKEDLAQKRKILEANLGLKSEEQERKGTETQIHQQRANVYQYLAENPAGKIVTPGDGRVYTVNTRTGEKTDLGVDTLSNEEKIKLQTQGRIDVAKETGVQARETEGTKQAGRMELQSAEDKAAMERERLRLSDPNKNLQLPTQQSRAIITRANQLISQDATVAKFIDFDPISGMPRVKTPGKLGIFGLGTELTPERAKEINDYIYGSATDTKPAASGKAKPEEKRKTDPLGIR